MAAPNVPNRIINQIAKSAGMAFRRGAVLGRGGDEFPSVEEFIVSLYREPVAPFPVYHNADTTSGSISTAATSMSVTYPANISEGDLLLFMGGTASNITTSILGFTSVAAGSNTAELHIFKKLATGTETGTVTWDFGGSSDVGVWVMYRISGATGDVEAAAFSAATGTTVNPPAVTPSWGLLNNGFVGVGVYVDGNITMSVGSGNLNNDLNIRTSSTAPGVGLVVGNAESAATSYDPSSFTISASTPRTGTTLAIKPGVPGTNDFTFTGSDGAAWGSGWTFTVGSGDILTNRGRMVTGTGGFDGRSAYIDVGIPDISATIDVEIPTNDAQFPEVRFRFDPVNFDYVRFLMEPHNDTWTLHSYDNDVQTALLASGSFTVVGGDIVHIKLVGLGTAVSVKLWKNADPEPGTVNGSGTTSLGQTNTKLMVRTVTSNLGVAVTNYWDNLVLAPAFSVTTLTGFWGLAVSLVAGVSFSELFTGTNGAAWDSDWTLVTNGGTIDIQSNRGRMVTAATAFFETNAELTGHPVANFDMYVDLLIDANTFTFPVIFYRVNSVGAGSDDYYRVAYAVQSDTFYVEKYIGFSLSSTPGSVTKTTVPGDTLRIRIQANGNNHKGKAWVLPASEPGTWDWEFTDSFNATETRISLGHQTGSALANRCDWDNFTILDL